MNDYKSNFAIMIPQAFMRMFGKHRYYVPFECKDKVLPFERWIEEGNLKQCQIEGKYINIWVSFFDGSFDNPASLQKHFDDFCKPITFEVHTYSIKTTPINMDEVKNEFKTQGFLNGTQVENRGTRQMYNEFDGKVLDKLVVSNTMHNQQDVKDFITFLEIHKHCFPFIPKTNG